MSATGNPRTAAEAGFTLLELLVAVGIMALVAGIGFPALQHRLAERAAGEAAATLRLALAEARSDALASGGPVSVTVALAADGAMIAFDNGRASLPLPAKIPALDWPRAGFTFYPDGTAEGGPATLGQGADARHLSVDRDVGQIAVASGRAQP